MTRRIGLDHDQLNFLLSVAEAGDVGLVVPSSKDGVVDLPIGLVDWSFSRKEWRATIAPLGAQMVAAIRAKDARGAA